VVFLNSFWNASSSVPLAANKHHGLAVVYLFFTSLSLLLAYPLIRILGLSGAGIALTTCEIAMSIYVVQMSNKLLSDRWPAFAASMLELTPFCALREKLFRRSV
jgi:O-antigen/teichoic acid export membrane protein